MCMPSTVVTLKNTPAPMLTPTTSIAPFLKKFVSVPLGSSHYGNVQWAFRNTFRDLSKQTPPAYYLVHITRTNNSHILTVSGAGNIRDLFFLSFFFLFNFAWGAGYMRNNMVTRLQHIRRDLHLCLEDKGKVAVKTLQWKCRVECF